MTIFDWLKVFAAIMLIGGITLATHDKPVTKAIVDANGSLALELEEQSSEKNLNPPIRDNIRCIVK